MAQKFEEIIDSLCNHKISKGQALQEIIDIFNNFKIAGTEFVIDGIAFTSESNHGYITAKIPYGYDLIKARFKKGDIIYVSVIPY